MKKYKVRIFDTNHTIVVNGRPVKTPTEFLVSESEISEVIQKIRLHSLQHCVIEPVEEDQDEKN